MKFGNQDGTGFGFGSFGAGQTQAPPDRPKTLIFCCLSLF